MNRFKSLFPIIIIALISSSFSLSLSFVRAQEPVSPMISLGSKIINTIYTAGGGVLYVCIDFIISSCYYLMDLVSLFLSMWNVISSCISVVLVFVGIITSMCFSIPFCGGIPSICVAIFCNVPLSCINLCTTLTSFLMDLFSKVLEAFEVVNERFGGTA